MIDYSVNSQPLNFKRILIFSPEAVRPNHPPPDEHSSQSVD